MKIVPKDDNVEEISFIGWVVYAGGQKHKARYYPGKCIVIEPSMVGKYIDLTRQVYRKVGRRWVKIDDPERDVTNQPRSA